MNVSSKEQKLSWEFTRAIEAASHKGRVILVIDGVTQVRAGAHMVFYALTCVVGLSLEL